MNTHKISFQRSVDVLSTEFVDETLLLRLSDGMYFGLGETGSFLWSRLEKAAYADNLAMAVASEYGVSPDNIEGDVVEFLQGLVTHGLAKSSRETAACELEVVVPGARSGRYAAPRLESGYLRNAASGNSGQLDGGFTESGGIGGLGS
ncbi:MAG TPA: PqqD family protein [Bryobacteraceae bacterium]|nr:PqqD family protein [Bryobacteraceae bacterium]